MPEHQMHHRCCCCRFYSCCLSRYSCGTGAACHVLSDAECQPSNVGGSTCCCRRCRRCSESCSCCKSTLREAPSRMNLCSSRVAHLLLQVMPLLLRFLQLPGLLPQHSAQLQRTVSLLHLSHLQQVQASTRRGLAAGHCHGMKMAAAVLGGGQHLPLPHSRADQAL